MGLRFGLAWFAFMIHTRQRRLMSLTGTVISLPAVIHLTFSYVVGYSEGFVLPTSRGRVGCGWHWCWCWCWRGRRISGGHDQKVRQVRLSEHC